MNSSISRVILDAAVRFRKADDRAYPIGAAKFAMRGNGPRE